MSSGECQCTNNTGFKRADSFPVTSSADVSTYVGASYGVSEKHLMGTRNCSQKVLIRAGLYQWSNLENHDPVHLDQITSGQDDNTDLTIYCVNRAVVGTFVCELPWWAISWFLMVGYGTWLNSFFLSIWWPMVTRWVKIDLQVFIGSFFSQGKRNIPIYAFLHLPCYTIYITCGHP